MQARFWLTGLLALGCVTQAPAQALRLCTGSPGKTYHAVGEKLAELLPAMSGNAVTVEVLATGGSIDNLNKLMAGDCDGAIVQGDAVEFFTTQISPDAAENIRMVTPLYQELSLLLCSQESGIDEIDDLPDTEGASVAAGAMGSGSLATWLTFRNIKPEYESVKVLPRNGAEGALAVANGEASCVFEVIAPQSDFIQALNDNTEIAGKLGFAEVDDGFDGYQVDGKQIYTRVTFDDEKYDNLSSWGDPELIAITAYLVVSEAWASGQSDGMSALTMTLLTGKADVEAVAYGEGGKPFSD